MVKKQLNYYYDCEFIEGFKHNRFFGKKIPKWLSTPKHSISLISISVVCEDGRTYSAISNEYRYQDASDWVKQNVIHPLYIDTVQGYARQHIYSDNFHKHYGKSNCEIAKELVNFFKPILFYETNEILIKPRNKPILYGYYSAYDHVLLSSLFGEMVSLPDFMPMYTVDLQQMLVERSVDILENSCMCIEDISELTNFEIANFIRDNHHDFPESPKFHLSKDDSLYNKKLHEFILKNSQPIKDGK